MAELTPEQLAELRVYATAAALKYHDQVVPEAERVDLAASFAVHSDLRLVAADVLRVACLHASSESTLDTAATKRIKVGPIEIEKAVKAGIPANQLNADAWCSRARELTGLVITGKRAGLIRSPLGGMASGNNPEPVFSVTRNDWRGRE